MIMRAFWLVEDTRPKSKNLTFHVFQISRTFLWDFPITSSEGAICIFAIILVSAFVKNQNSQKDHNQLRNRASNQQARLRWTL